MSRYIDDNLEIFSYDSDEEASNESDERHDSNEEVSNEETDK